MSQYAPVDFLLRLSALRSSSLLSVAVVATDSVAEVSDSVD